MVWIWFVLKLIMLSCLYVLSMLGKVVKWLFDVNRMCRWCSCGRLLGSVDSVLLVRLSILSVLVRLKILCGNLVSLYVSLSCCVFVSWLVCRCLRVWVMGRKWVVVVLIVGLIGWILLGLIEYLCMILLYFFYKCVMWC